MNPPQQWPKVDIEIKKYIDGFIELLQKHLENNLVGIYLHGSLATGSYYFPKSDMDILAVVTDRLTPELAKELNISIAKYSDTRPTVGDIEFSIITALSAKNVPKPIPYELHYSSSWHERILNDDVQYGDDQFDTDLYVHLLYVNKRGSCLYGEPIDGVFGDVDWKDFMFSVLDDLDWILDDENIVESPYYCILNICRSFQLLNENVQNIYSKDEGGEWGSTNFPKKFKPLINNALSIYRSSNLVDEANRKTGGFNWNKEELLAFRDYARERLTYYNQN
ncbi:DUF4111 domain-containing protein [Virgibacillus dakarensis]|nr:DUF4111 domain-containing protein [Virgibacillus dakarensis]